MFKAVLWDVDGTLVDSVSLHHEAVLFALKEMGVGFVPKEIKPTWEEIWGDVGGVSDELAAFEGNAINYYLQHISNIAPREDCVDCVRMLNSFGIPQAVVSNCCKEIILANINRAGLEMIIKEVIGREDVRKGKPAPDPYLLGARKLGFNARECIVVEDSWQGIVSAKAAGALTIFLSNAYQHQVIPDHSIADIRNFPWKDYLMCMQ